MAAGTIHQQSGTRLETQQSTRTTCSDNGVRDYELQAAQWELCTSRRIFGHYSFMRTIYLHGEIALFDAHPVMTLRGLSDTMRVRTVIGTSLLPGLCSEGECETVTHYLLVEPSTVSTNQGRLLYLAQVKRPRQH